MGADSVARLTAEHSHAPESRFLLPTRGRPLSLVSRVEPGRQVEQWTPRKPWKPQLESRRSPRRLFLLPVLPSVLGRLGLGMVSALLVSRHEPVGVRQSVIGLLLFGRSRRECAEGVAQPRLLQRG